MTECERPPRLSHEQVAAALGRYLGVQVTAVRDLPGSVANQDFMVHTASGDTASGDSASGEVAAADVIVKAGPEAELRAEAWACRRLRHEGIAVPEIVGLETDCRLLPVPFLVIRRLPGAALEEGEHDVLVEAGRQLRVVHTITGEGYGPPTPAPNLDPSDPTHPSPKGGYPTWTDVIEEPLTDLHELVLHDVVGEHLAAGVRETFARHAEAVSYHDKGVLLHGDLKLSHVFAEQGRFTGIIDWGDVAFGDPRYDLARFSIGGNIGGNIGGDPALAALLRGYDLVPDAELAVTFAMYRVLWNTRALHYEWRAGGDWFAVYRSRIETDLRTLHSV